MMLHLAQNPGCGVLVLLGVFVNDWRHIPNDDFATVGTLTARRKSRTVRMNVDRKDWLIIMVDPRRLEDFHLFLEEAFFFIVVGKPDFFSSFVGLNWHINF
jgi:hypothetical protein